MQIGLVVDPRVFSATVITDRHSRNEADLLMRAVRQNALLLTGDRRTLVDHMKSAVDQLDTGLGLQLRIGVEEFAKDAKRFIATWTPLHGANRTWDQAYIRRLASELKADAIVCATGDDMAAYCDLERDGIEVIEIREYSRSATEGRRQRYREAVRLDDIQDIATRDLVVGKAIKYARRVSLIDPYMASAAVRGRADRYVGAVAYVVELWQRFSPYVADGGLDVELMTAGGRGDATDDLADATAARRVLDSAVKLSVRQDVMGALQVTVKQDATPRKFLDRFLEAKRRCWAIRHGIDCLGDLARPSGKRRPTFIEPASDDNRALVMQLRDLPDA